MRLPTAASPASRRRYALARELGGSFPSAIGAILVVTGSVALGLADDASDLELYGWTADLPTPETLTAAIVAADGRDVQLMPEPRGPDSIGAIFRFRDVWVDAEWMALAALDRRVALLAAGEASSGQVVLAWVLRHALPLRGADQLLPRQRLLDRYPERLRERIIAGQAAFFGHPIGLAALWTYARRPQPLVLADRLLLVTTASLRLLFAVNRQWQPDWKWLPAVTRDLDHRPERLVERVEATVTALALEQRVATALGLARDVLALAPPRPDIEQARAIVERCLLLNTPDAVT